MQAGVFPARQGFIWFRCGFALWRTAFVPLTASVMTMYMCVMLGFLIPLANLLAIGLLQPALGVGLFVCCQAVAKGRKVLPGLLFRNLGRHLRSLVSLFVVRFIGDTACFFLAVLLTGISLDRMAMPAQLTEQGMEASLGQLLPLFGVFLVLRIPLKMATWYTAPLRTLRGMTLGKALFFSFFACWRNMLPLACFLFVYASLAVILPSLVLSLLAAVAPGLAQMLTIPVLMALTPIFYGGFYQSACDIFGEWPEEA